MAESHARRVPSRREYRLRPTEVGAGRAYAPDRAAVAGEQPEPRVGGRKGELPVWQRAQARHRVLAQRQVDRCTPPALGPAAKAGLAGQRPAAGGIEAAAVRRPGDTAKVVIV